MSQGAIRHFMGTRAIWINIEANPGSRAPRAVRFVTVIQMVGSLLAVPVGIGSAYTFYRANFSPETTCQSLRSGIIAMLDKGVDASTQAHPRASRRREFRKDLRRG